MSVDQHPQDAQLRHFRPALLLLGLLGLLTLGWLLLQEHELEAVYSRHQAAYHAAAPGGAREPSRGIHQLQGPLGADRCVTCHLGIQDHPQGQTGRHPHRSHQPALLEHHPPRTFGCTSCHRGNGGYVDRCLPAAGRARDAQQAQASCSWCQVTPGSILTLRLRGSISKILFMPERSTTTPPCSGRVAPVKWVPELAGTRGVAVLFANSTSC